MSPFNVVWFEPKAARLNTWTPLKTRPVIVPIKGFPVLYPPTCILDMPFSTFSFASTKQEI